MACAVRALYLKTLAKRQKEFALKQGDVSGKALASELPEADLYLFGRGEAQRAYLVFGCHRVSEPDDAESRFRFAVWAPNAKGVSVVGDFNEWDQSANPMEQVRKGIWSCVVTGLEDGSTYKYSVVGADGTVRLKADPYAFHAENGLSTASKVWDLSGYEWSDDEWLAKR